MPADLKGKYVVGLLLDPAQQQVVLIRKNRPVWMKGMWNGPGGHMQQGETAREAVAREFEEETGVAIAPKAWQMMVAMNALAISRPGERVVVYFFTATSEKFWNVKTQTDEYVGCFQIHDLPRTIIGNLRWLIPMAAMDNPLNWPYAIEEAVQ